MEIAKSKLENYSKLLTGIKTGVEHLTEKLKNINIVILWIIWLLETICYFLHFLDVRIYVLVSPLEIYILMWICLTLYSQPPNSFEARSDMGNEELILAQLDFCEEKLAVLHSEEKLLDSVMNVNIILFHHSNNGSTKSILFEISIAKMSAMSLRANFILGRKAILLKRKRWNEQTSWHSRSVNIWDKIWRLINRIDCFVHFC